MSWRTQNWAGEQKAPSPAAKLILIGLASCSDADHCAYPSVGWLVEWSGLERKTVLKWLAELSDDKGGTVTPMITDTGRRKGRSLQIKVWRLNAGPDGDKAASKPERETIPKTGQSQKREHPKNGERQSQKRDTEPYLNTTPLTIPDGIVPPAEKLDERIVHVNGRQPMSDETVRALNAVAAAVCADMADEPVKPHPLPADWTPPAVAELSDMARQLVEQWPAGAYQAVCEVFRLHWANETRAVGRKSNWNAALSKWLIKEHAQVTRDAKAGVSFARLSTAPAGTAKGVPPVAAKARETTTSGNIHAAVKRMIGEAMHAQWIKPCALLLNPAVNELQIIAPSDFLAGYVEQSYSAELRKACAENTQRTGVFKLQFVTERNAP